MAYPTSVKLGERYGRLLVIEKLGSRQSNNGKKAIWWLCSCDCGKTHEVKSTYLSRTYKPTRSCGCIHSESVIAKNTKHGGRSKFLKQGRYLIGTWQGMKQRCLSTTAVSYRYYGARGVDIYHEWIESFEAFRDWIEANLGDRPEGFTLDRIDNDRGYCPGNLRWADRLTQLKNRRPSKTRSK
jgi:hypothetical protein